MMRMLVRLQRLSTGTLRRWANAAARFRHLVVVPLAASLALLVISPPLVAGFLPDDDSPAAGSATLAAGWGHLKGRIRVEGKVADPAPLTVEQDRDFCLKDGNVIVDETVIVGPDQGLRDVYVMLYLARGDLAPPVHPSYEVLKQQVVVIDNVRCRFEPHAGFVRVGQTLRMKNSDPIGHNVHTLNNHEQNKNVPPGDSVEVKYDQPDRVPADIECNIHPFMKGLLLVREDPYVAITNAQGEFQIENLPAGELKFQFWHKKTGYLTALRREGEEFLGRRGEFALTIEEGGTVDLGELTLSAEVLNAK